LLLLLAFTACASQYHVKLDPPRQGITPQERVELFWKMRPTEDGWVKHNGEVVNRTLFLGDKQATTEQIEVVSPEDLEPLVGSNSETMQHARRSIAARNKAKSWTWAAYATVLGGFIVGVALSDSDAGFGPSRSWIGWGIALGGVLGVYPVARHYANVELESRKQAFETYPRDLGLLLNVCAHGTQVIPCEAPVETPSEPKPPGTTTPGRTALLRMRR
jgi:hypothetical protein